MAKTAGTTSATQPEFKPPTEHEIEVDFLMRATGRSRVQVLNAIKVRGPDRDKVLRALSSR